MTLQFRRTVAAGVEACLHVRERTRKNPVLREVHVPHHFTMRWAQFHERGRFEHTAASCRGRRATATEREALRGWIEQLLVLRASDLSRRAKAKRALALTAESKVVWPTVKAVSREVKRHAWDDRSRAARMGLGGAAVAGAVFGGQSAGPGRAWNSDRRSAVGGIWRGGDLLRGPVRGDHPGRSPRFGPATEPKHLRA